MQLLRNPRPNRRLGQMPGRVKIAIGAVFFRYHNRLGRPLDGEFWIIPADAALTVWGVELVDQIECLGVISQSDKSVREAFGERTSYVDFQP